MRLNILQHSFSLFLVERSLSQTEVSKTSDRSIKQMFTVYLSEMFITILRIKLILCTFKRSLSPEVFLNQFCTNVIPLAIGIQHSLVHARSPASDVV